MTALDEPVHLERDGNPPVGTLLRQALAAAALAAATDPQDGDDLDASKPG